MKKSVLIAAAAVSLLALAACGQKSSGTSSSSTAKAEKITVAGSTALQPLVEANVESFIQENTNLQITVQGGGSGLGLSQVSSGAIQIGNSDLFAEEKDASLAEKVKDHKVAVVGFAPIVNKDIKVDGLTSAQLKDIFTGKVTNWKEVGGQDQAITVINRAEGSGTRFNFEKYGLDNAKVVKASEQDSSGAVVQMVSQTPGAISYVAFSNIKDTVKALELDGVKPTEKNVATNDWKIWSYEHMYTEKGNTTDGQEKFITTVTKNKTLLEKLGYLSVEEMKVTRDQEGNIK
ncbi:phosphate ABC transporter substrate-binding protein [Pseudolactococcus reticulitermitis]|uniref:Phosphate-binding protein n=1 Tax=Pseudolactococcus reticulitermitis TaxID=2025039 RepID=A0A224XA17_9LACT|nr:phosphate ABC transporter substrate-binding protein [Lactococcus reticulitermitis]GAX46575.1 phosphate ABC transporter, periplasmic phosphate-binding protein PstS [Lactococcus reticulitermitis]